MEVKFLTNSINDELENIYQITKQNPPDCFKNIKNKEINFIKKKVKEKFDINIKKNLVINIRSLYIKFLILINHKNILENSDKIKNDYSKKVDILDLSTKFNISPLNLLRFLFKEKYNKKLTKLIDSNLLNKYDNNQLNKAIKNDFYCLVNQNNILKKTLNFEKKIEKILIKNKLNLKLYIILRRTNKKIY